MNKLTDVPAARVVPPALQKDPEVMALAESILAQLRALAGQKRQMVIFPRIDELPEEVLDILAYDMKIDWYDEDYPIDIKRATIKGSIIVHRHKGTKYAVEKALGEVFPGTKVEEWFEYGGEPYMFRIIVNTTASGVSEDKQDDVLAKVRFYKNLRSHLEIINYESISSGDIVMSGATMGSASVIIYPEEG